MNNQSNSSDLTKQHNFLHFFQEPLNSEDDVSDEEGQELFDTENVVVCQYDKVISTEQNPRILLSLLFFLSSHNL